MMGPLQYALHCIVAADPSIPIRPPAASSIAEGVDRLHFFLTGLTLFFTGFIFLAILYFMVKYRRRSEDEQPAETEEHLSLELTWTLIPTFLCVVIFVWSSSLYFRNSRPPSASTEIFVIGKQWMWHLQHPEGPREINELHVPLGVPVKLTMTSEDVIHDFYIPAFRVKKDVLPGRYTSIWFEATKIGTYHLFCAQYCGADHAEMIGWVYVMSPTDYAAWLSGGAKDESMAQTGERLFNQLGCVTCHVSDGTGRGPSLAGLYGKPEVLRSGETRIVDETLIRQAIVHPNSIILPKYPPIMPTFQGQINEEQVLQLIAYVKSLGTEERKTSGK
ncbi:MAG: cytochrome c oxidase subunit II [Candidatus Acidiferrales bacterium]